MSISKRRDAEMAENSGKPYAIQDCETGRIGVAQQTDPETQDFKILFWVSDEMVQEAADHIAARRTQRQGP